MSNAKNTTTFRDSSLSLKQQVANEIRNRIMKGYYGLGQKLSENQLAKDLNTSRAPVHDALVTLRNQGLVDIFPQRGSFVFNPDLQAIHLMHEASCAYEVGALSLSLERAPQKLLKNMKKHFEQMKKAGNDHEKWTQADRAFHAAIVQAADNEHLAQAYEIISYRTAALVFHSSFSVERIESSLAQHLSILKYIEANDFSNAAKLLQINNTGLETFINFE